MPLDTRIALGAQPLQIESPLAQYGQAVGIQNAMQQNQLGQMQMSAAQRAMQEEEGIKNFLSTNPDLNDVANQRRLLAFGSKGLAYGKAISEQKKASLDVDKTTAEILGLNQKNFTALNPPIRAAAGGIPGITAYVEAMYADPVLGTLAKKVKPKEQALKENIEMYTKDPDQWITAHSNLEGAQMLDALKMNAERVAERDRIASLPPLPAAAPTGTVNDARAALAVPGAQPVQARPVAAAGELVPVALNALAPAAAPVNALTGNETTLQAISVESKKLNDRLDVLDRMPFSKGKEDETKRIEARLKELNAPINLRADGTSIIPGKGALTAAAAPSDILRLQREEAALRAAGKTKEADVIAGQIKVKNQLRDDRAEMEKLVDAEIAARKNGELRKAADLAEQIAVKNQMRDDRTAAQKEQAVLDNPRSTAAQKATATSQLAKLNQLTDNRTETQKEFAVLADPNASKEAKDAATKRIAKLVDIPAKAVDGAIERYNFAKSNDGYKGSFTDFITLSTPKTTISLTQNAEKSYGTAFGGKIADLDVAKYDAAGRAPELAANANRVLSILNQGDVFVGPAATIKLNLARVLNAAGASNDEKIANTETLISGLGRNTLGMIKGSGLGTAQGFTDKDLQFLERVAGGSIDYNAQTLRTLTDLSHKAATASAETWNKRAKEIPASALGGTGISVEPIVVPARVTKAAAATRPAGVPAEWTLQVDAAGKKAYVSPDGKSFKEVP